MKNINNTLSKNRIKKRFSNKNKNTRRKNMIIKKGGTKTDENLKKNPNKFLTVRVSLPDGSVTDLQGDTSNTIEETVNQLKSDGTKNYRNEGNVTNEGVNEKINKLEKMYEEMVKKINTMMEIIQENKLRENVFDSGENVLDDFDIDMELPPIPDLEPVDVSERNLQSDENEDDEDIFTAFGDIDD